MVLTTNRGWLEGAAMHVTLAPLEMTFPQFSSLKVHKHESTLRGTLHIKSLLFPPLYEARMLAWHPHWRSWFFYVNFVIWDLTLDRRLLPVKRNQENLCEDFSWA